MNWEFMLNVSSNHRKLDIKQKSLHYFSFVCFLNVNKETNLDRYLLSGD